MTLHAKLAQDTLPVCETPHAHILLMNDSRWPWLILVPLDSDACELHDLTHSHRNGFMADVNQVSRVVQKVTGCKSVNIAMLGNVVSQLHCHVIARDEDDPNWPAPVWGYKTAEAYVNNVPQPLLDALRTSFS